MVKATSSAKPIVRFERKGQRLVIKKASRRICSIVANQLTYNYVKHIRGQEARRKGRHVDVIPTECFYVVLDDDGVVPPQILTAAGYYPKLRQAFRDSGYVVKFKDNTARSAVSAHTPC